MLREKKIQSITNLTSVAEVILPHLNIATDIGESQTNKQTIIAIPMMFLSQVFLTLITLRHKYKKKEENFVKTTQKQMFDRTHFARSTYLSSDIFCFWHKLKR